ncbi:hypothetical protein FEM03_13435 [Phragmitibacter flavus]|uniref:Uncharacterized protein n=1 Tax=Phragmitibacter flavus TaxID=2576071 RepID=A0A5R8KF16_9BACT|nr:hypothetical protein [Phragmitibacter flavus]TLD70189.1 hypothetical protein FEM03_13435 [Phragmitibacter flavus]
MDPFPKDDPLHQLLGKTRAVEPRPNFTQNVMRTVRNTPQDRGWRVSLMARLENFPRLKLAATTGAMAIAAAVALALLVTNNSQESSTSSPGIIIASASAESATLPVDLVETSTPDESIVASELDSMDQLSDLLASQDTTSLTDGEIAMLLY